MKNYTNAAFVMIALCIIVIFAQIQGVKTSQEEMNAKLLSEIQELKETSQQSSVIMTSVSSERIEGLEKEAIELTPLVEKVLPSVVSILTDFGTGTGVVVSGNKVLTNFHVMQYARAATIVDNEGRSYSVNLVGHDSWRDLALLEINGTLSALTLADSDLVKVGQRVMAAGDPYGLEGSVSEGIVSSVRELNEIKIIQHTVPINQGNSGGPLVNMNGEVIGINTFKMEGTEGIGFATPSNEVKEFLAELS